MIGQKGIPARFGGVETHVEQVATRLAARGHDVWAFCRSRMIQDRDLAALQAESGDNGLEQRNGAWRYRGVRLVGRPSLNTKHFDAATHTFLCSAESALAHDFDIVHFHGIGPSAFAFIPRVAGRKVVSTMHALDWRQVKWGARASWLLKRGERIGARTSSGVIAVSKILVDYLKREYGVAAAHIPNGATPGRPRPPRLIREYGLAGDDYILAVGRIIPDRGLHHLIEAFNRLDTSLRLVIVGSEMPRTAYSDHLQKLANERVLFTGNLFGEALQELYSNCRLYVLASSVEGLPITVCEAMGYARGQLLSDIPENREVAGDAAKYFKSSDSNSLYESLKNLIEDREALSELGNRGIRRVESEFNWDHIADAVERFYRQLVNA